MFCSEMGGIWEAKRDEMGMKEAWRSREGKGSELGSVSPPALAWVKKAELRAVAPLAGAVQPLATRDGWRCHRQLERFHRQLERCHRLQAVSTCDLIRDVLS